MLKFGLEIVLGMIQKSDAANFEILIFRDFSGGQSANFGPNGRFVTTQFYVKIDNFFHKVRFPLYLEYPLHVNGYKIKINNN